MLQSGLNHQYWPYAAKHACMAHNIAEEYEMDSPWKVKKGKRWNGPQIPFGARVDYWTGPKNKVKSSARFDPSSIPGVFLGYPLHPGLIWRGDFLVAPLKSIMDKPFEETVTVIRANNIALPNSGISFPLRLRHDCMREGLWPLPEPPGDPEKRNSSDSSLIPELLEESRKEKKDRIADEAAEFEKSNDEIHERRDKGDLAPVGPEAAVSDVPKPDEDGMITVLDEKTGKFVKIPAESTSHYSASGYKARKYKGSSKPDSIPTSLWRAASKKARKEAIEKDKLEKARAKHSAAPAVVRDQDGDPVPRMPVDYNHVERHRERIAQTISAETQAFSAMVARSVGAKEVASNPKAQKALDVEWEKLEQKGAWDYKSVVEWESIAEKARKAGGKLHVGAVFEICVEKGSELEEDNPLRKFKGRSVFQGNKVTDESAEVALFAELGSAPANMEAGTHTRRARDADPDTTAPHTRPPQQQSPWHSATHATHATRPRRRSLRHSGTHATRPRAIPMAQRHPRHTRDAPETQIPTAQRHPRNTPKSNPHGTAAPTPHTRRARDADPHGTAPHTRPAQQQSPIMLGAAGSMPQNAKFMFHAL